MKKKPLRQVIAEQVIGWGAIGGAVTEVAFPALLAIELSGAAGLATFGVLMVTGRADQALKGIAKLLDGLTDED